MTDFNKSNSDGMTKEDILQKLDLFGTDNAKIKYLKHIEPKIGILQPKTKKSLYKVLASLYESEKNLNESAKYYKKAGNHRKSDKLRIKLGWNNEEGYEIVAKHYEEIGDEDSAKKMWIKAGDFYFYKNNLPLAKEYYKKAGLTEEEQFERPLKIALRDGNHKKAKEYYQNAGKNDKLEKILLERGDSYISYGNFGVAEDIYRVVGLSDDEKNMRYGDTFANKGKFREAADYYEKAGAENKVKEMFSRHLDNIFQNGFSKEEIQEIYQEFVKKNIILWGNNEAVSSLCRGRKRLEKYCKKSGLTENETFEKIGDGYLNLVEKWFFSGVDNIKSRRPKDSSIYQLAAEYYEKAGLREKANSARLRAVDYEIKENPHKVDEILKLAKKIEMTNKEVFEKIADRYCLEPDNIDIANIYMAEKYYKKAELMTDKKTLEKIGDAYLGLAATKGYGWANETVTAAEYYEKAGLKEKANNTYIELADWLMKNGKRDREKEFALKCYKKAGLTEEEQFERAGDMSENGYTARKYYEKAGLDDTSNDIEKLKKLAKTYSESDWNISKAMDIHRRIKRLSKK